MVVGDKEERAWHRRRKVWMGRTVRALAIQGNLHQLTNASIKKFEEIKKSKSACPQIRKGVIEAQA
eukprot:347128-Karenia_brevis.AAC.1